MSTTLLQIVTFTAVGASDEVTLPHNININGAPITPDWVALDSPGFSITVTDTTITVINNNSITTTVNVWLEQKHSIPRQLGGGINNLNPQPFVIAGANDTGGGGGGTSVITNASLTGNGTSGSPLGTTTGHTAVATDTDTISGNGTTGSPLTTVAGGTAIVSDGVTITGNGTTGSPITAVGGGGGATLIPANAPILGSFTAAAGKYNQINNMHSGDISVTFPVASASTNGTILGLALFPGGVLGLLTLIPNGTDTIAGSDAATWAAATIDISDGATFSVLFISDGVSNWIPTAPVGSWAR
jgi:hypothetical protein